MKKIASAAKSEDAKNSKGNVGSAFTVSVPGGGELTFDLDHFRPSKVSVSGLTNRARLILVKDPPKRTEPELRALMVLITLHTYFRQFYILLNLPTFECFCIFIEYHILINISKIISR